MILKKYFGNTIQEALKSAKEALGSQLILIESVAPQGDKSASVTVMLDDKLSSTQTEQEKSKQDEEFRNVFYKRTDVSTKKAAQPKEVVKDLFVDDEQEAELETVVPVQHKAYQSASKLPKETVPVATPAFETPNLKRKKTSQTKAEPTPEHELPEPKGMDAPEAPMSRRAAPLIEIRQSESAPSSNGYVKEVSVSREISALHRRLEQLESMLSESLISASLDYASHGAFQQLVQTGIRADRKSVV